MTQTIKKASIDISPETYAKGLKGLRRMSAKLEIELSQLDRKIEACETNINYKDRRIEFVKLLQQCKTKNEQLKNIENSMLDFKDR